MSDSNQTIVFNYKFKFKNNFEKEFNVELDPETLNLIHTPKSPYPEWTSLNFFKSLRVIFPEACFVPRRLGYPVACCGVVH